MAKQKKCHKFIFKLHSTEFFKNDWNLTKNINEFDVRKNDIVSLNDSQVLTFLDEMCGFSQNEEMAKIIKKEIAEIRMKFFGKELKNKLKSKYDELYKLQHQPNYICVIMDSKKHYDDIFEKCILSKEDMQRKLIYVNGIPFRRLLGTNGGIKNSTIIFVNDALHKDLIERIDCGRNPNCEFVLAKLEAYKALSCSGSIPLSRIPNMIIVDDCETEFYSDVIYIDDSKNRNALGDTDYIQNEPLVEYIKNKKCNLVDSDGYGLMTPEYSMEINNELYDCEYKDKYLSGVNTRFAWTKGMLFTFDFKKFARVKAKDYKIDEMGIESAFVFDAWGNKRNVFDADAILTVSMVKLWDSYNSYEDYISNCEKYKYEFRIAKTAPHVQDEMRQSNYQFLQPYELSDEDLETLCKPTLDEIRDVLSEDYRKSILYLSGLSLNKRNIKNIKDYSQLALMTDGNIINDTYFRNKINRMIRRKMNDCKIGSINLEGNFAIISGDPYLFCSNMFELGNEKENALLNSGECYYKYWIDKDVYDIVAFRAPMTNAFNLRKLKVVNPTNDSRDFSWYQYMPTTLVLNSFDTTCDALNGADKDSDTFFTTNNRVLLSRTKELPAIQCAQKKPTKQIYDERKTVEANKISFGDEIGSITNTATSMIEVQAGFPKDSQEYKELEYRIQCSQSFQQSSIDSAKGIIFIPMPEIWKNKSACSIKKNDSEDIIRLKEFYSRVCAYRKPYFFIYRYQEEKKNYIKFKKSYEVNSIWKFEEKLDVLLDQYALDKTVLNERQLEFIESYYKYMPVGTNPCTVNRICWFFEDAFENIKLLNKNKTFDHSIYKCPNVDETSSEYTKLKKELQMKLKDYSRMCAEVYSEHSYDANIEVRNDKIANMRDAIITECLSLCSDKRMLCNALVDVYYTSDNSKQLCWDVCGDVIFKNLLHRNNYKLEYPERSSDGDIEFNGFKFKINTVEWRIDDETNCK